MQLLPSIHFTPDGCEHLIRTESVAFKLSPSTLEDSFSISFISKANGLVHFHEVLGRGDAAIADSNSPDGMDASCFFINDSHTFIAITPNVNLTHAYQQLCETANITRAITKSLDCDTV
jgi:hypothetical protein